MFLNRVTVGRPLNESIATELKHLSREFSWPNADVNSYHYSRESAGNPAALDAGNFVNLDGR